MKFLKWIVLTEDELDEQYKIIADRAITLGYNRAMIKAYDLYAVDERDFYEYASLTDAFRDNHVDEDGYAHIGEKTPIPQRFLDAFKDSNSIG